MFVVAFAISLAAPLGRTTSRSSCATRASSISRSCKTYAETTFGGDFPTPADYLDPYIRERFSAPGNLAVYPPNHYYYDTLNYFSKAPNPAPPSRENWLGTDDRGRDVFARLMYGFRVSVLFGLVLTVIGTVLGVLAGAVQGYFGGKTDLSVPAPHRNLELDAGALPADHLRVDLRAELCLLLVLLSLFGWIGLSDYVRAEFLRNRTAGLRARGAGDGAVELADHLASRPAEQPHAGDHVPAVSHERRDPRADQPRLSRPRRAAADAVARRTARAGQGESRRVVDLDVDVRRAGR